MNDLSRLQIEYESRKGRMANRDLYSWFNRASLFAIQERQKAVLGMLKRYSYSDFSGVRVLEMGCGEGGVLREFLSFGAPPQNLHGVDFLFDRLSHAQHTLPGSHFANADGQSLPFPSRSFDLVLQSTAISSILDAEVRRNVGREMLRVVRRDGLILSYDFWLNPTNPQTRGLRPAEIRQLFPGCRYEFRRITLAPPIARGLASVSWGLCLFLESLKIFNTHYLAAIRPA